MKPPRSARWCQNCAHYCFAAPHPPCEKGHRPNYYQPKTPWGPYGFKRRCHDFKEAVLKRFEWMTKEEQFRFIRSL